MAYVQKEMTGTLFVNDRKETKKHPDFTGTITIKGGQQLNIAGWKSQTKAGKKILSLRLEYPRSASPKEYDPSNEGRAPKEEYDPFNDGLA